MKKLSILLFLFVFSSGCSLFGKKDYNQQLMSPCASSNDGPCKHIPVNIWLGKVVYQA